VDKAEKAFWIVKFVSFFYSRIALLHQNGIHVALLFFIIVKVEVIVVNVVIVVIVVIVAIVVIVVIVAIVVIVVNVVILLDFAFFVVWSCNNDCS
jgi:hypothetical protein